MASSLPECAFMCKRDEATIPFANTNAVINANASVSLWKLNPITNAVSALMPIMCRLALTRAKASANAKKALISAAPKKKNNSGMASIVMLLLIRM